MTPTSDARLPKFPSARTNAAEEQAFWTEVRKAHAAMGHEERAGYVPDATLGDDLADQVDDALAAEDAW